MQDTNYNLAKEREMKNLDKTQSYDLIGNTTRRALVKLVFEKKYSIRKASLALNIKYTSGKSLI